MVVTQLGTTTLGVFVTQHFLGAVARGRTGIHRTAGAALIRRTGVAFLPVWVRAVCKVSGAAPTRLGSCPPGSGGRAGRKRGPGEGTVARDGGS